MGISLESCLYPTYKSRRPISESTHKFLEWLSTRPPGPVILLAHSMGGLLAADAATGTSAQSKRIIGLVAFDVPFLGMHPHVIVSGITSLFPKDTEGGKNTEKEMNDETMVTIMESGDVESVSERSLNGALFSQLTSTSPSLKRPQDKATSSSTSRTSLSNYSSRSRSGSQLEEEWEAHKATFCSPPSPLSPRSESTLSSNRKPSPSSSIKSFVTSFTDPKRLKLPALPAPLAGKLDHAADKLLQKAETPLVRWLRKHADDPLSAMTAWVVEHFEFGICQFDPAGLSERYHALEHWSGHWTNFWTQTPARAGKESEGGGDGEGNGETAEALPSNTADLVQYTEADASTDRAQVKARKNAEKALRKEREKERKHGGSRPARHFIVLPHLNGAEGSPLHFGSREKWELVPINGVEDEVGAHCGLFIRSQNSEYEELVERVAHKLEGWCQEL
ncbi:hypothetical protein EW145_g4500 [Phellinidium pouzarii]|uniref:AB hydrolase-1 domain-containing protein n=1 Tax=Phellinidium pouzarii TaxID=167371 RepID=A0A4S4L383_9AGAM|nr:hypothetical protein EW145_g4500 [Phellinidium pouzarii]